MPENNAIVAIMPINKDLFILSIDRLSNLVGLKASKHYFLHRFIVKHMTNSTLQKQLFQIGAVIAGLAVVAGAFGSHAIKENIDSANYDIYQTAVTYQFYHAFAMLIIGLGIRRIKENVAKLAMVLFVLGIIFFSGSLYLLSTSTIWASSHLTWLGMIAPVGGLCFVAGWAYLAKKGYKPSESSNSAEKVQNMQRRKSPTFEEK
jgi:uncharacterized membrane protein YgdD (TMEM256/DUF423 family)